MATGKIANLSVGVSLDAAEFSNGLTKTEAQAKSWNDRLVKNADLAGLAIGGALAAGIGSFVAKLNEAADAIDAFNDLRDATGASIENISALDDVARRTGATFQTVEGVLVKFNKVLGEARDNNGAGDALKALGLSAEELKRIDPAEALRQAAVALAQFADDGNKARIIQELFGKSVKEAAPLLKDLSEQGSLVATTTTAQAEAAERYNKQLFALNANASNFARTLTSEVLPVLSQTFAYLSGDVEAGSFDAGAAAARAKGLSAALGRAVSEYEKLSEADRAKSTETSRAKRLREDIDVLRVSAAAANEETKKLYANPDLVKNQTQTQSAASNPLPDLGKLEEERKVREKAEKEADAARERSAKAAASAAERAQEGARRYIDGLDKQLGKLRELSTAEQVIDDIVKGRVQFQDAAQAGRALDFADQIDQSKRLADQLAAEDEQLKLLNAGRKSDLEEVARVVDAARTPQEKYNAEVERLDFLQRNAGLSAQDYSRAVALSAERMKDAQEKANTANKAMTEFAKQAERNIQDALGQTIEDSISGNFDSIGQMWVKLIQKMAAQALAARLNDALFGGSGSNSGALLKGIAGLFGAASGVGSAGNAGYGDYKAFFDSVATGHATGTNYIPYDNYPALLHKGEAVVPAKYNPANGGMGTGASFDFSGQTINVGEGVSRGEVMAAVEAGNAQTIMKIRRTMQQQRGA